MEALSRFFDLVPAKLGEILPRVRALRNSREKKSDGSYVTRGDLAVQETVLNLIHQHIPDATVISEEIADSAPAEKPGGLVLVIDPIDGTENFTSGLPEWGVSISAYRDGQHAGSMLGCPEMNLWLRSGQEVERFTSRIRGISSSLSRDDLLRITQGYEYRVLGCCVYNMINVVRGSFQSFENPKGANSWDILAGLNLALEHGLMVTVEDQPYTGAYLAPTRKYRFKVENQLTRDGP